MGTSIQAVFYAIFLRVFAKRGLVRNLVNDGAALYSRVAYTLALQSVNVLTRHLKLGHGVGLAKKVWNIYLWPSEFSCVQIKYVYRRPYI